MLALDGGCATSNDIDVALGTDVNQLNLFDKNGFKSLTLSNKTNQAFLLLKHISKLFKEKNEQSN